MNVINRKVRVEVRADLYWKPLAHHVKLNIFICQSRTVQLLTRWFESNALTKADISASHSNTRRPA